MIYALKEYVTHLEYWKLDSKKLNIYIHIFRNRMAAPINRTRITKEHVERTLLSLIDDMKENRIDIPPHQREYCWTHPQQTKFIISILKGYPIPSILMSGSRNINEKATLEDGRQRITTAMKFRQGEFTCENRKYAELSEREQERFDDERVIVITFYNATPEQRIEIFDWHQNGAPLTPGERYHAHQTTPLIKFVKDTLMTPGIGLHDRAAAIWGIRGDTPGVQSKDTRRKWLQSAVALITGIAYGPMYMNKNYQTVVDKGFMTSPSFNDRKKRAVYADLERIISIYEEVQRIQPIPGTSWLNKNWDMGNFTGYIAYSLSSLERERYNELAQDKNDFDNDAYTPDSLASENDEWNRIKTTWINYIVGIRRKTINSPGKNFTTLLRENHHSGLGKDRNWKLERWEKGYNFIFYPDTITATINDTLEDDSDSDIDSTS